MLGASIKLIKHMIDNANFFSEETGLRFGCIQTPAESCAHR